MLIPAGLYVEVISSKSLLDLEGMVSDLEKEHVTYALYNRLINSYKVCLLDLSNLYPDLNREDLRFTVDTKEDFDFIDDIICQIQVDNVDFAKIIEIIDYVVNNDLLENLKLESGKEINSKNYLGACLT